MWVKYRHNFAYGHGRWDYLEIPDDWYEGYKKDFPDDEKDALGEFLDDEYRLCKEYDYSEKYRGFDYEKIDGYPPFDILIKRLKSAKRNAEHYANEVKRFQEMVDIAGEITKDDFNV